MVSYIATGANTNPNSSLDPLDQRDLVVLWIKPFVRYIYKYLRCEDDGDTNDYSCQKMYTLVRLASLKSILAKCVTR